MNLAPKWVDYFCQSVCEASHLMLEYGQSSHAGHVAGLLLTSVALALKDEPETEALVRERLCCSLTKHIWTEWYKDTLSVNTKEVRKFESSLDLDKMLQNLRNNHD